MDGALRPPPWADPAWHAAASAWITDRLAERKVTVRGPLEPRLRPWSAVLGVPTSDGRCWFKATAPAMADDAALTPLLAAARPDLVLQPLAVDADRRWMLLPDGGDRLRDRMDPAARVWHWERILPAYAELQLAFEGADRTLLAAGALDRRPERIADLLVDLLDERHWLRIGEPSGLTAAELAWVRDLVPRLAEANAELAAAGIGATIQHDDLHDGNVVVSDAGYRIMDWGDAGLAHPFGTLLVTLNSLGDDLAPGGPEWTRLTDAYLEPFTARLPAARLRSLVPHARWSAMVGRALTWRAALPYATSAELGEWGSAVPEWLRELAAEAPAA
jgi:hypothetical protein